MRSQISLLITVAVVALACTDAAVPATAGPVAGPSPPTDPVTTTSAPPAPQTTATNATTTTTPTTPADEAGAALELPDNFGSDFPYVWDEIQAFIDHMSVDPDPTLVDVIIDPDCNCYQFWVDLFTELDDNGWHYTGDAVTSQVRVLVETGDEVGLAVTQQVPASSVLDEAGNVIRDEEARVVTSSVALKRDEEGRWRIFNVVAS